MNEKITKIGKTLCITLVIIILLILGVYLIVNIKINQKINAGNELISKIEKYKSEYGYPPLKIVDIGYLETEEGTFHYNRIDSMNYELYFSAYSVGETIKYSSVNKKWNR